MQLTLSAPEGVYEVRQATNTGSNVHEALVHTGLGTIQHFENA